MAEPLPPFDPQWLAAEEAMGGRMIMPAEPVEQSRKRFAGVFAGVAPFLPPPTDAVKAVDVQIAPAQRFRIYIPAAANTPLPVGLYIHSGGWFAGAVEAEDHLCRLIAEKSQIILFSPEYRLAPENPYPAGLEDCCAAYEFMHARASEFGGSAKKKFIMGGSAGGNLAACVGLKYVSNATMQPAGLILACMAACDPQALPAEYKARYTPERFADAPMVGNEIVKQAREWYNARPDDPLYSPLLHPDIKLLPRVYVTGGTKDPLYQETLFFYEECKKQGVQAEWVEWVGWPHFFWIVPMLSKTAEFMEMWCQKLTAMIAAAG